MSDLTQPFIDEHLELMQEIEVLKQVADMIGVAPLITLHEQLDALYEFLTHQLRPHAPRKRQTRQSAIRKVEHPRRRRRAKRHLDRQCDGWLLLCLSTNSLRRLDLRSVNQH